VGGGAYQWQSNTNKALCIDLPMGLETDGAQMQLWDCAEAVRGQGLPRRNLAPTLVGSAREKPMTRSKLINISRSALEGVPGLGVEGGKTGYRTTDPDCTDVCNHYDCTTCIQLYWTSSPDQCVPGCVSGL
jgi:hypothetical protein